MKRFELILGVLLLSGFAFGQEVDTARIEELDIGQIKEKAKADAKADFIGIWCLGYSVLGYSTNAYLWKSDLGQHRMLQAWLGVMAVPQLFPVFIPRHRERQLESIDEEYRNVYRTRYRREIRIRRLVSLSFAFIGGLLAFFTDAAETNIGTCFGSETKINMADGSVKNIEHIEIGDSVLSYNTVTKEIEPDEVLELYSPANKNMMKMEFSDGRVIHSTFDHPYYVKNKGWCSLRPNVTRNLITNIRDVSQLEEGDICYLLVDGELAEVEFVGSEPLPTFQRTYAIKKLKKNNAFFAEGILVGVETVKDKVDTVSTTDTK